jgi:TusA-related sulfurtransferase
VWNGVVGTVGFETAAAALRRLREPEAPSRGYRVLDFESARSLDLSAAPDPACPVCGSRASRAPEAYPSAAAACAAPAAGAGPAAGRSLDLEEERCPMNLLRARQALDGMEAGETIEIRLGEEGAATVPDGLAALGHEVLAREPRGRGLRLVARARRGPKSPRGTLDRALLERFARQVVLPGFGEEGQRRLLDARVAVGGGGAAFVAAAVYLAAAGVGTLLLASDERVGDRAGRFPFAAADRDLPLAAALARALARVSAGEVRAERGDGGAVAATARGDALAEGARVADAVSRRVVGGASRSVAAESAVQP